VLPSSTAGPEPDNDLAQATVAGQPPAAWPVRRHGQMQRYTAEFRSPEPFQVLPVREPLVLGAGEVLVLRGRRRRAMSSGPRRSTRWAML
jgi:hypothetical protein